MTKPPAGFNTKELVREPPPKDAVMIALKVAVTPAAEAVKVVELEPPGTVTDAGRVREELLEVILTAAPPGGARPVRMRVHVLEPAGARLDGTHASEFGTTVGAAGAAAIKVRDAFSEAPPKEALRMAVPFALTDEALAVNVAEIDPAGTTTDDGTLRLLLLLLIASVDPPLGAAPLSVTVQLDVPGVVMAEGLHAKELKVGIEPTVTVPPLALAAKDPPAEVAATPLAAPILITPAETEGVMTTVATTPSAIPAVFNPVATH